MVLHLVISDELTVFITLVLPSNGGYGLVMWSLRGRF